MGNVRATAVESSDRAAIMAVAGSGRRVQLSRASGETEIEGRCPGEI